MKVVQETIQKAVQAKGLMAEEQARLEVRVNFARELLITKMARFVKEKIETMHPLQCSQHKALSYDLVTVCGDKFAKEVNLGGLLVRPSIANRDIVFSLFGSYDPIDSVLKTIVAITPNTAMEVDVFTSTRLLTGKPIPEVGKDSAAINNSTVYVETGPSGKELHVDCTELVWPHMDGESYFKYLNDLWEYTADVLFAVAGPGKKEGVL